MSSVESWDPSVTQLTEEHRSILQKTSNSLDESGMGLSVQELDTMRPAMHLNAELWRPFVDAVASEEIVGWIRVLTLLERDYPGFETGEESPVLTLIEVLKQRQAVPKDLFKWIRENSNNRFLPYGNLANRL